MLKILFEAFEMSVTSKKQFYDSQELAVLLDVKVDWIKYNRRKSNKPIPYKKFGNFVRYDKSEVLEWFGRKDLELEFYSTRTVAEKLGISVDWLNHNRLSSHPIPYRRMGKLVRYNKTELTYWLNKHNH